MREEQNWLLPLTIVPHRLLEADQVAIQLKTLWVSRRSGPNYVLRNWPWQITRRATLTARRTGAALKRLASVNRKPSAFRLFSSFAPLGWGLASSRAAVHGRLSRIRGSSPDFTRFTTAGCGTHVRLNDWLAVPTAHRTLPKRCRGLFVAPTQRTARPAAWRSREGQRAAGR